MEWKITSQNIRRETLKKMEHMEGQSGNFIYPIRSAYGPNNGFRPQNFG